jgi:small subunit ribosomal protein S11
MDTKKVTDQKKEAPVAEQATAAAPAVAAKVAPAAPKRMRFESVRVYVNASYNNTVITVTDPIGNVLTWASAGAIGFSGPKKATPFAASKIIAIIAEKLKNIGVTSLEVYLKGIGGGRDSAVRSLVNHGFTVTALRDVTPIPHNGPRPRKVRRV